MLRSNRLSVVGKIRLAKGLVTQESSVYNDTSLIVTADLSNSSILLKKASGLLNTNETLEEY